MPKLLLGATIFFGLLNSLLLEAQGSVSLYVCNAGKVDVDVFLSQSGNVSDSHVRPADCASVAKTVGGMEPGYVGIALADSRGQWRAAKRLDILPDFGAGVLSRVTQNVPVRHGNANVSLPMQLLFRPRVPTCTSPSTYSARANLPLNATSAQIAAAAREDASRATEKTVCETLAYTMNVEGFADTSEITFKPKCDSCDKKAEAQLTPEQRAARQRQADAANQVIGTLSTLGPLGAVFGSVANRDKQDSEEDRKARESRLSPTQRMDWSDLLTALRKPGSKIWEKIPRNLIVRGTVSGVEVSKDAFERIEWVDIAFRESPVTDLGPNRRPYSEFNVCASGREIFQSVFGPDFLTSMIGKTIEVEGETQGAYCRGLRGSIRITLAHQVRPVKSVQFEAGSAPKFVPPPTQPVAPATAVEDARNRQAHEAQIQYLQELKRKKKHTDACVAQSEQFAKAHPGDIDLIRKEYYACLQSPDTPAPAPGAPGAVPAPSAAPAPAVDSSAAARAKAEQERQKRIEQQQAAAQRQRSAEMEKAQKIAACVQQVQKAYPDGGRSDPAGFQRAYLACVQQAQQAR